MPIEPPDFSNPYLAIQQIMRALRDPQQGCPWDLEQTSRSIGPALVEESYEVLDAIEALDEQNPETWEELKKELGDYIFQAVFHTQLAAEKGRFQLDDVLRSVCEKLVFRHPHVFGANSSQTSAEQVLVNWEALKRQEREKNPATPSGMLDSIPRHLPALQKAQRIGSKVAKVNFDWPQNQEGHQALRAKVLEEFEEFFHELPADAEVFNSNPARETHHPVASQKERATEELGDIFFALAQLARHYHLDAEMALQKASKKFQQRFARMESRFADQLSAGQHPSAEQWEQAWQQAKAAEKPG